MQFGAHILGVGALAEPATLVEVARLAESAGYHSVFSFDRDKALRRLEQIAAEVIEPYQRSV